MAGAGYKLFNTGDVLTAAQVNTYLQEQVVMVFANATARTTALSGVLAEGMVSFLKDTDSLEIYSGTAWVAYGSGDITGITTGATSGLTGGVTSGTADLKFNTTAKGGLLVGTGSGTVSELSVGTNAQVLTADSTTATGLKWATASSTVSFSGCELTNSGNNYSIANNTWTRVTFNQETYDVGGFAAAGSTITIPSGRGGYYLVCGWGYWDQNATGNRLIKIYKNGTGVYQDRGWITNASAYPTSSIRNVVSVAAADTIELYVFQSSGAALNFYVYPADAGLSVAFLGA